MHGNTLMADYSRYFCQMRRSVAIPLRLVLAAGNAAQKHDREPDVFGSYQCLGRVGYAGIYTLFACTMSVSRQLKKCRHGDILCRIGEKPA